MPRSFPFEDSLLIVVAVAGLFTISKYILDRIESGDDKDLVKRKAAAQASLQKLEASGTTDDSRSQGQDNARRKKEELDLNQYEQLIALEVVAPHEISVTFKDIGGLDNIIDELKESVIYPLTMPEIYSKSSSLLSAPSGVLLHGPPGCGKTMIAKALARESGATFINLHISTMTEKWYGDSNKLVNAMFSLARKLEPTIVFVDEIDAVLGTRRSDDHEASGMVKAEFMTHWDGLMSANASGRPQRVVILGATNRMNDIDQAILRRMPKKFQIALPAAGQRRKIFALVLQNTKIDEKSFDLDFLVRVTEGMSGSDIKEACRDAAMIPVRDFVRLKKAAGDSIDAVTAEDIRGLQTRDFFIGHAKSMTQDTGFSNGVSKKISADQKSS